MVPCLLLKRRAASAILLHVPPGRMAGPGVAHAWPGGSMLLDCGEGTWGAMVRWLGRERAAAQVNPGGHASLLLSARPQAA